MIIILIILLTVLSIALRLATMSVNSARLITKKSQNIKDKVSKKTPELEKKIAKKAGRAVADTSMRVASSALNTVRLVVTWLRNLLLHVSFTAMCVEFLIFILLVAVASGITTLIGQ